MKMKPEDIANIAAIAEAAITTAIAAKAAYDRIRATAQGDEVDFRALDARIQAASSRLDLAIATLPEETAEQPGE